MKKLTLLLSFICNLSYKAQDRVINPGVPFLLVADARAAGMADMGLQLRQMLFLNNGIQPNMLLLLMPRGFY
jgi:hypothetical protein